MGPPYRHLCTKLLVLLLHCLRLDCAEYSCLCINLCTAFIAFKACLLCTHCLQSTDLFCCQMQFAGLQMYWMATATVQMVQASLMARPLPQAPTLELSTHPPAATAGDCASTQPSLELCRPQSAMSRVLRTRPTPTLLTLLLTMLLVGYCSSSYPAWPAFDGA